MSSNATSNWFRLKAFVSSSSGEARLARAVSWNLLGGATSRAFALFGSFLVARSLGEVGYGQLAMLLATFSTLGLFASFGLGTTATRFISLHRADHPDQAGRIATFVPVFSTIVGCLAILAVIHFATPLSAFALNDTKMTPLIRLAAPLLVLGAIQDSLQGVLSGLESFRALARCTTVTGFLVAIGMVVGSLVGGITGCILGMIVGSLLGCLVTLHSTQRELKKIGTSFGSEGWLKEASHLWRFALPAFLSSAFVAPVNWLAMAMLAHQPAGLSQVGIFNAANQWRTAILHVPFLVASAGLPVITQLWKKSVGDQYVKLVRLKMLIGFLTSSAVGIPIMVAAPMIMSGYGQTFSNNSAVLIILAATAIISATLTMIGQTLVSEGRMWIALLLNGLWAAMLLVTAALWIPSYGALGLAFANLAAFGFHLITVSTYVVLVLFGGPSRSQTQHSVSPNND